MWITKRFKRKKEKRRNEEQKPMLHISNRNINEADDNLNAAFAASKLIRETSKRILKNISILTRITNGVACYSLTFLGLYNQGGWIWLVSEKARNYVG